MVERCMMFCHLSPFLRGVRDAALTGIAGQLLEQTLAAVFIKTNLLKQTSFKARFMSASESSTKGTNFQHTHRIDEIVALSHL